MDPTSPPLPGPAPHAVSEASAWLRWRHGVVRDLAWVLASPPLLQPNTPGVRWLGADWGRRAWLASADWLATLDRDPAPLQDVLVRRPGRLGTYFESLLTFWLAWPGNPLYRLLGHNLPVRRRNLTLGELDFLVQDRESGEIQHWEVAVKFYLGVAPGGDHAGWIGPGRKDRLDLKVERLLRHQLALTASPEGRRVLQDKDLPDPVPACLLRGRLFYPSVALPETWAPAGAAAGHLHGWWMPEADFLRHYAGSELRWLRLPREHWLAPVDLTHGDSSVRIGEPQTAAKLIEELEAAADNRAAAVIGLRDLREVCRGFITRPDWPYSPEPS